tara:strand:- start:743 stop:859 length:117 start_codon:yes stop_codon:yes gene_type:complete
MGVGVWSKCRTRIVEKFFVSLSMKRLWAKYKENNNENR